MKMSLPRIHSLSTIGIKQHFSADYLLHPNRTDFSGESGSGKSMVSDMIQLILVGSGDFSSSTDGNKPREVKGMLLPSRGKATSKGYIFLNIEVEPSRFIVIGAYIESSTNQADLFIIQSGFDWDSLSPLENPIFSKHLVFEDQIFPINELTHKLESGVLKKFKRKTYHQILFRNDIISLDLTKNETLKSYASILRSFSRGKGFNVDSKSLKNFLFGSDEQNIIRQNYESEISGITNDFHEHKRYKKEIALIQDKQQVLKNVIDRFDIHERLLEQYLTTKLNFWTKKEKAAKAKKKEIDEKYYTHLIQELEVQKRLLEIEGNDLQSLKSLRAEESQLSFSSEKDEVENLNNAQSKFQKASDIHSHIGKIQSLLDQNKGSIDASIQSFAQHRIKVEEANELRKFTHFLIGHSILLDFEDSIWNSGNYDESNMIFENKLKELTNELDELAFILKFSDIGNEESLSSWAFDNLKFPVRKEQESILHYFQRFPRKQPHPKKKGDRYLPFPDDLFDQLDIKEINDIGFWLNLDGVYEFIEFPEKQFLNFSAPQRIKETLLKNKDDAELKIREVEGKIEKHQSLKNLLNEYPTIKIGVELYDRKEEISNFAFDESLKGISQEMFDIYLAEYEDKEVHIAELQRAETEYLKLKAAKDKLTEIQTKIEAIEQVSFKEQRNVPIHTIEEKRKELTSRIEEIRDNIKSVCDENDLDRDEIVRLCEFDFYESRRDYFLENQVQLKEFTGDLKSQKENNNGVLDQAEKKIKESKTEYFQAFNRKISVIESVPEDNSELNLETLEKEVNAALVSFQENYKLAMKSVDSNIQNFSFDIGELAHSLLPTVFTHGTIDRSLVSNEIAERLNKLAAMMQEIGSRKIQILKRIFDEVDRVYNDYRTKVVSINNSLKSRGITGGNRASLESSEALDYPVSWMTPFRKQLATQLGNVGIFEKLNEEVDINQFMIQAFRDSGGTYDAEPEDLINPKSYFNLEFDLKLENGESNSGSNGQTYTGNALLAIARLSLIEEDKKKGIKVMPIDEAEGLGSNYSMLHELAKKEGYQIISMGIETTGDIIEGEQYIYIMNENKIGDFDSYVPPLAIFSGGNITQNIEDYLQ